MTRFFFDNILLPDGWAENALIEVDDGGWITSVTVDRAFDGADYRGTISVPGMPNCHSHSFQRAMAGLTEFGGQTDNNF